MEKTNSFENEIISIALNLWPNINLSEMIKENEEEWIDLLRCAVLKKIEEQKEIEKFLNGLWS